MLDSHATKVTGPDYILSSSEESKKLHYGEKRYTNHPDMIGITWTLTGYPETSTS